MEVIYTLGTIARSIISLYMLLLWARLVLDWVMVLNRSFRPRGILAVLVELVFSLTDPPLRAFRKVLPPLRLGNISIDLGWMLTMISCMVLKAFIPGWW